MFNTRRLAHLTTLARHEVGRARGIWPRQPRRGVLGTKPRCSDVAPQDDEGLVARLGGTQALARPGLDGGRRTPGGRHAAPW